MREVQVSNPGCQPGMVVHRLRLKCSGLLLMLVGQTAAHTGSKLANVPGSNDPGDLNFFIYSLYIYKFNFIN